MTQVEQRGARVSDLLREARRLIERPTNWCQGAAAKDARGRSVPVSSEDAVAFCANGAICRAAGTTRPKGRKYLLAALENWNRSINFWNDSLRPREGHQAVLDAFDAAIHIAELDESPQGAQG